MVARVDRSDLETFALLMTVSWEWRIPNRNARLLGNFQRLSGGGYSCPGLKYVPTVTIGIKRFIFEMVFLGTYNMSPGLRCASSSRLPVLSISLRLNWWDSAQSLETRRKTQTCECFGASVRPPAMATA